MKRKYLIASFLLISVFNSSYSQVLEKSYTGILNKLKFTSVSTIELDESLQILGNIIDASFNESGNFVITTDDPSLVYLYDQEGNQVRQVGSLGRGPFEILRSKIVKYRDDNISVWDHGQLKLLRFTEKGAPIYEVSDFRYSIRDLEIKDDWIYFYNSGKSSGPIIERYNLNENKYDGNWGQRTEAHTLLLINEEAGGLVLDEDMLHYVSPSQLGIHTVDLTTGTESFIPIKDSEFKITPVADAASLINNNRNEMINILNESSYTKSILLLDEYIILIAETGSMRKSSLFGTWDSSERNVKVYVLDRDSKTLIDIFVLPKSFPGIWSSNGRSVALFSSFNILHDDPKLALQDPTQFLFFWNIEPEE